MSAKGPGLTYSSSAPVLLPEMRTIGTVKHLPDAAGVLGALQRIGYSLEESVADLIDNSIDAGASTVLLRFLRTGEQLLNLTIVDDGRGMTAARLDQAMTFGLQTGKREEELGKYGMGLKSASFAQCDALTVVTRQKGDVSGQRWTVEGIAEGWVCERLNGSDASEYLDQDWGAVSTSSHGTAVIWDRLDAFAVAAGRADNLLATFIQRFEHHLGLHFHRFLSERVTILIDTLDVDDRRLGPLHPVKPLDPFAYPRTGRRSYPRTYKCVVKDLGVLELEAHIWPARSKLPGYRLGGGRVSRRQGFYFYRNDRLIQAGGWNGWRDDAEPHASLARVAVDLPPQFDEAFALNVQKTALVVPMGFFEALDQARTPDAKHRFTEYVADAVASYRARDPIAKSETPFVPTEGLGREVRRSIRAAVANANQDAFEMRFEWGALPAETFFEIRRDDSTIILNNLWRKQLLAGRKASKNDLPVIKSLLYLLLRDELGRERMREEGRRWLEICQQILLAAVRDE